MSFISDDIIEFVDNGYDCDLSNQLNSDDAPPPVYNETEISSVWEVNKSEIIKRNNIYRIDEEINQIKQDFGVNDNLFDENMIQLYDASVQLIELNDIAFNNDTLPDKFKNLKNIKKFSLIYTNLKSFDNMPPLLTELTLNFCGLTIVDASIFPKSLTYLNLSNNKIILITDINPNITDLILNYNYIEYITDLPAIERISLKSNKIKDVMMFKDGTEYLDLNNNSIEHIEALTNTVSFLDIARNPISIITVFPECIKVFLAYNCRISKIICEFPETLEKIDLYNNLLTSVPIIPLFLKWIDLSENELESIPTPLKNVEYLDISSNDKLKKLNKKEWLEYELNSMNRTYVYNKIYQYSDVTNNIDSFNNDSDAESSESISMTSVDEYIVSGNDNEINAISNNVYTTHDNISNDRNIHDLIKHIREKNMQKSEVEQSQIIIKKTYKEDRNNYIELKSTYIV